MLTMPQWGPYINATYALGAYQEDFEYIARHGDLDVHNGRWCKTPEYPAGTYCYFVTLDAALQPEYPYTIGLTYYGIVQPGILAPAAATIPHRVLRPYTHPPL